MSLRLMGEHMKEREHETVALPGSVSTSRHCSVSPTGLPRWFTANLKGVHDMTQVIG